MTVFLVTDPDSGRKVKLTGDSPPTEEELEQIFNSLPAMNTPLSEPIKDRAKTVADVGATLLSSAVAEPAAGVAGLATGVITQDPAAAAAVVEGVRDRLTIEPQTEKGKEFLSDAGEAIAPATEAFAKAEDFLGDTTLEATGSPALAAMAKTIPTALLELAGASVAKGVTKLKSGRDLNRALEEATPTVDELKNSSRVVFQEIDELGATVKPESMRSLTKSIERAARGAGGSPRTTPGAFGVIDDFMDVAETGVPVTLRELDELRTVAQNAAKTIDPAQKAPAIAIIDEIDTFLDRSG